MLCYLSNISKIHISSIIDTYKYRKEAVRYSCKVSRGKIIKMIIT